MGNCHSGKTKKNVSLQMEAEEEWKPMMAERSEGVESNGGSSISKSTAALQTLACPNTPLVPGELRGDLTASKGHASSSPLRTSGLQSGAAPKSNSFSTTMEDQRCRPPEVNCQNSDAQEEGITAPSQHPVSPSLLTVPLEQLKPVPGLHPFPNPLSQAKEHPKTPREAWPKPRVSRRPLPPEAMRTGNDSVKILCPAVIVRATETPQPRAQEPPNTQASVKEPSGQAMQKGKTTGPTGQAIAGGTGGPGKTEPSHAPQKLIPQMNTRTEYMRKQPELEVPSLQKQAAASGALNGILYEKKAKCPLPKTSPGGQGPKDKTTNKTNLSRLIGKHTVVVMAMAPSLVPNTTPTNSPNANSLINRGPGEAAAPTPSSPNAAPPSPVPTPLVPKQSQAQGKAPVISDIQATTSDLATRRKLKPVRRSGKDALPLGGQASTPERESISGGWGQQQEVSGELPGQTQSNSFCVPASPFVTPRSELLNREAPTSMREIFQAIFKESGHADGKPFKEFPNVLAFSPIENVVMKPLGPAQSPVPVVTTPQTQITPVPKKPEATTQRDHPKLQAIQKKAKKKKRQRVLANTKAGNVKVNAEEERKEENKEEVQSPSPPPSPKHPEGQWHPFTINQSCSRRIRCRHRENTSRPKNITQWLHVRRNYLCEPPWVTTATVAASLALRHVGLDGGAR